MTPASGAVSRQDISGVHHRRETCRVCDDGQLGIFLSLGPMPLANAFLRSPEEFAGEPRYPLDLSFCESCSHLQLVDVIDPAVLFKEYLYVTGTSETMNEHNRQHATALAEELELGTGDLVVEVASNDGSLLRWFRTIGTRTLGIEPAANIAELARESGVETVTTFFDSVAADDIVERYGLARLVIAKNVLAHVDDPRDFLVGCGRLAGTTGVIVIEVPYVADMVERGEYDTVYHEHLSYFSMTSLIRLSETAGLVVDRVNRLPIHGGSLQLMLRSRAADTGHCPDALALAAAERTAGLDQLARYEEFAADAFRNRDAVREMLEGLAREGRSIAAYGAPAKGNTLLNWCGIGTSLVEFTVDRNPLKVGMFTPGMHLPVHPVSTLLSRQPDCALLLTWNLADEIRNQQGEYQARGGRFVVPIPHPRFV
jgi:hypothetical protein